MTTDKYTENKPEVADGDDRSQVLRLAHHLEEILNRCPALEKAEVTDILNVGSGEETYILEIACVNGDCNWWTGIDMVAEIDRQLDRKYRVDSASAKGLHITIFRLIKRKVMK